MTVLSEEEQDRAVLKYAKRRLIQAVSAGGLEDPFIEPRQIVRKFGVLGWPAVKRLLEKERLVEVEDGLIVHKSGTRRLGARP